MRIAFATDWWLPRTGGIESQIFDLAAVLSRRGHDVHVLTTTSGPTPLPDLPIDRVRHVDVPKVGPIAVPDPRRVDAIAAHLSAIAPDVVHAHGMFSPFAIGAVLAAERIGCASVFSVHSLLRPLPVFLAASALFRAFVNRATVRTAVSAATAADVEKASGRSVLRIPNALTLADWRDAGSRRGRPCVGPADSRRGRPCVGPADVQSTGVRILAAMRLAPKKRPLDLVRALAAATDRAPHAVTLDIAGDGPARPALEREARRLGVLDRIRFHGACSREQVRQLMAGASFLTLPGSREAFGLALLEARASGIPVVAMASGGVGELVEHGCNGLLARSRREFCTMVAAMSADETLRRRCAAAAAQHLEAYDWSHVAPQHEAAYALACGRRQTSGRQVKNRVAAAI